MPNEFIPEWVDQQKYLATGVQARWNGIHAALDVALEEQAARARQKALKDCKHEWSDKIGKAARFGGLSKACVKCGFIEDMR